MSNNELERAKDKIRSLTKTLEALEKTLVEIDHRFGATPIELIDAITLVRTELNNSHEKPKTVDEWLSLLQHVEINTVWITQDIHIVFRWETITGTTGELYLVQSKNKNQPIQYDSETPPELLEAIMSKLARTATRKVW